MDIFTRIEYYRSGYTNSEKKISQLILESPQLVEELTVSRIADYAHTSKSAVLRFCQKLGYSGYSEFRFDMIRALHGKRGQAQDTTLLETYTRLFASGLEEMARLPQQELLDLVRGIHDAPIVRCLGMLGSSLPALKFYYDFTALGKNVIPFTDPVMPGTVSSLAGSDLLLYFSISGRIINSNVADFLDQARELGCRVVLVTCSGKAALARYADQVFVLPTLQLSSEATIDERALMLVFVNILAGYYKTEL